MAGEPSITIVGNLTGDPELRFTPSGAAVVNLTIAATPRSFDRASGEWKEGETVFMRATAWREHAENIANSLKKGMRVVAQGNLKSHSYETKEGQMRTSLELDIEEIAPSLRFATATVTRTQRSGGNFGGDQQFGGYNGGGAARQEAPARQEPQQAPAQNSWGEQSGGNYDWGSGSDEEAPF